MDAFGRTGPAFGVADDPAYGVAGRDRAGADELFAFLQGDVGHLPRRGVDLIQRTLRKRIDLNGIDVAIAGRLHAGGRVGLLNARARIARFRLQLRFLQWLELSRERQQL